MSWHFRMEIHEFDQSLSHALEDWETHKRLVKLEIVMSALLQVAAADVEAASLVKVGDGNETQKTFPSNNGQVKSESKVNNVHSEMLNKITHLFSCGSEKNSKYIKTLEHWPKYTF